MGRDEHRCTIWELDPREKEYEYEDFERLFLDAWEYRFRDRPGEARVRPYLQRYFRFRVIPPWLRVYIREALGGEAIDNIANAPLDPAIDWRLLPWHLLRVLYVFPPGTWSGRRRGPYLEA